MLKSKVPAVFMIQSITDEHTRTKDNGSVGDSDRASTVEGAPKQVTPKIEVTNTTTREGGKRVIKLPSLQQPDPNIRFENETPADVDGHSISPNSVQKLRPQRLDRTGSIQSALDWETMGLEQDRVKITD